VTDWHVELVGHEFGVEHGTTHVPEMPTFSFVTVITVPLAVWS
jgi:hypothetical protein